MTPEVWAILLLWGTLFVYALAGSVDFGAGFWAMLFSGRKNGAAEIANRYVSPLWEVTNVFLVLFMVGLVGFFPLAAFTYGTLLLIPGSLILILLALRGSFLVFAYTTQAYSKLLRVVSGITGVLLPSLFVSVLPISEGGFVSRINGQYHLQLGKLFASPIEYAYLGFGLATELFFSSLLMADYSRAAGNEGSYRAFRKAAIWLGPVTLCMAICAQLLMPQESSWLQIRLEQAWPLFLLSLGAFALGYGALWMNPNKRATAGLPRLAVFSIACQYAFAHFAYGWAHMPYLLYPYLTLAESFTNGVMFQALLVILAVGLAILFPGFIWIWRLFMEDKRYVTGGPKH